MSLVILTQTIWMNGDSMTVKELKEKLNQFPDNLIVVVPNSDLHLLPNPVWYVPAKNVSRGCNEDDRLLLIVE